MWGEAHSAHYERVFLIAPSPGAKSSTFVYAHTHAHLQSSLVLVAHRGNRKFSCFTRTRDRFCWRTCRCHVHWSHGVLYCALLQTNRAGTMPTESVPPVGRLSSTRGTAAFARWAWPAAMPARRLQYAWWIAGSIVYSTSATLGRLNAMLCRHNCNNTTRFVVSRASHLEGWLRDAVVEGLVPLVVLRYSGPRGCRPSDSPLW